MSEDAPSPAADPIASTSSIDLLGRARGGDRLALNRLYTRYLPRLLGWARGRLPCWARSVADTSDIVQDTCVRFLNNLQRVDVARSDELQAYLHRAVQNRVTDHYRQALRRPTMSSMDGVEVASPPGESPLDAVLTQETALLYAAALRRLRPEEREAVVARFELGYSYEQIALLLRKRTADAGRMAVTRSLIRLAEQMRRAT